MDGDWEMALLSRMARAMASRSVTRVRLQNTYGPYPVSSLTCRALERLTKSPTPPNIPVRPTETAGVFFNFGDAAGSGFGNTWSKLGDEGEAEVMYGWWDDVYAAKSSNFREFVNQVQQIKRKLEEGAIREGAEIFLFTDNFVAECAFHKGNSKSRQLFELMLELRELQMEGRLFIHLIWVSGLRMIAQGTDGASRGDLSNGVLAGQDMLSFVPLNKGVDVRSQELVAWFSDTFVDTHFQALTPKGWFLEAHETGNFIWTPPPAAADVALEQLCESRHVRPWNTHLFLCPALMTGRWRKRLGKVADVMFVVPVGSKLWGTDMYEPVVVALILPLLSRSPWQVRRSPLVEHVKSGLLKVWSEDLERERSCLRKLWRDAASLGFVQGGMAC